MSKASIEFAYEELIRCFAGYANAPQVKLSVDETLAMQEYTIDGDGVQYAIVGGSEIGALYGTYTLLNHLGFYWFSPDAWDEEKPGELQLQELHLREKPSFEQRGFFAVEKRDSEAFLLWMIRNKMNLWTSRTCAPELCKVGQMSLRGYPSGGTHRACADYLPPAVYFAQHPEWYGLIDGQRSSNMPENAEADNICFSNDEACRTLAENLAKDLNEGALSNAKLVTFAPFDNGHWCQCDACKKLGNMTSQFMHLVYICQKVLAEKVSRKITLIVSAYHETLAIPDKPLPADFDYSSVLIEFFPIERCYVHNIDDDSCLANRILNERFLLWKNHTPFKVILCEYYNVSTFASLAFPLSKGMTHDLPYYCRSGISAMNYMHVSTALWGELAVNNWSFAALLWNVNADISVFYEKRYHGVASIMRRFYDTLGQATRNCKLLKHYQGMEPSAERGLKNFNMDRRLNDLSNNGPFFPPNHLSYAQDEGDVPCLLTSLRLLEEAKSLLKEAIANCGEDELLSQRLMMDMCRFSYTYDFFHFFEAYIRVRMKEVAGQDASQDARDLHKYGERLRQETKMQQHIRAEGAPNLRLYTNGLTITRMQEGYAALMQRYHLEVAPWQPDELRYVIQG